MKTTAKLKKDNSIGRLGALGVTLPEEVALLLPRSYIDLRHGSVHQDFSRLHLSMGRKVVVRCERLAGSKTNFDRRPAITTIMVSDKRGNTISSNVFGDSRPLLAKINKGSPFYLMGTVGEWNGNLQLSSPSFVDVADIGTVLSVYPGKEGVISPDTARMRVMEHLGMSIAAMSVMIESRFSADLAPGVPTRDMPAKNIGMLLKRIHMPTSPEDGLKAIGMLKLIAAYDLLRQARAASLRPASDSCAIPVTDDSISQIISGLSLSLTEEQEVAVREICNDIRKGDRPAHRLLSGDVGTGKTLVLGAVCAAVTRAGGTVAWLSPNAPLAAQTRDVLARHWPDMNAGLVAGDSDGIPNTKMLVGTTALNFRIVGKKIDLHITDEEQKMGVNAKTHLIGSDTHIVLATATCIPRTSALVSYGGLAVSVLTKPHVKKDITTRIMQAKDRARLFESIQATIKEGHQVLIVYPLAEKSEDAAKDLKSAEGAFAVWERHYPGKVRLVHGKMKDEEKSAAIQAMRDGDAVALISTSLTEAGIDLDRLRHVVIVHAERFGLSSLHQLRGRVARQGGKGICDLFLPEEIKEDSMNRLMILKNETDGFKVATFGMKLKGFGEFSGVKQSGESRTFIPGHVPSFDEVEWVATKLMND